VRIAVVSTFYPNSAVPLRTVFVRNLVSALEAHAQLTVVSPVPYAPPWPRKWVALRAIPGRTQDGSKDVFHPRFVVVPKLEVINGLSYSTAIAPVLRRLMRSRGVDLLHVHCAYPDAVGVALTATALRLPFVVTAHGSDINVYAERSAIRPQIAWALRRADAVIAVSRAIQRKIGALVPEIRDRVVHIPCAAVNREVFFPRERVFARRHLRLEKLGRLVVFVGQLVAIKALDVLLRAWEILLAASRVDGNDRLVLIGDGPLRRELERAAASPQMQSTVHLAGEMSQERVAYWLNAATLFCLPSRNEGTPNVIIEALACGRPVVASRVGGIPELICDNSNGLLVTPGNASQLASALDTALNLPWDGAQIAATVKEYTWEELAKRNHAVFVNVLAERGRVSHELVE